MGGIEIRPQKGPQEDFLASIADIVIYGGEAGGGKTWGLTVEPLRHINNPNFRFVTFRRTSPQITNPGGLQDEAMQVYPYFGAKATRPDSGITWTFPSGAVGRLTHLQHETNKYDWQGSQIPLINFDELTHFTESQFWYMVSRNRSTCGVRPYIRATCNAEPGWVADLIAWWIDDDGFVIQERSGVVRWFVREYGVLHWADTEAELREQFPDNEPKSLTFIRARLSDNKILMEKDPGYLANLQALPLIERMRLLGDKEKGANWKITASGGKVINRNWFKIIEPQMVPDGGVECRFWDFAATEKEMKGDDPDYTAAVKIRLIDDVPYVMDCIAVQAGPGEVDRLFRKTRDEDVRLARNARAEHRLRWEIEGGASGKRDNLRMIKDNAGYDAKGIRPDGKKLVRIKPFAIQAEHATVYVVRGEWNERWLTHLHNQPDWPHDDIMDATSGAYKELTQPKRSKPRASKY